MTQLILGHGKGLILDDAPRPRPKSQNDMVLEVMRGDPDKWWTPREIRSRVLFVFDVDAEAITSRIRELRQRGHAIECRKSRRPLSKAYEYKLKEWK